MARRGEIDPWNVDLEQVANRYLQVANATLALAETTESGQSRLRVTGKTLLYLAILLRMKSDLLAGYDPFADTLEDATFEDLAEYDEDGERIAPGVMPNEAVERFRAAMRQRVRSLEDVLQRRTSAKQPRIRPVTLDDLIRELRKFEALDRERATREKVEAVDQRRRRVKDFSNLSTADITALAHEEFQESLVEQVRQVLEDHLPAEPEARMDFTDLCDVSGLSPVVCFLALLFLEARMEVVVEQPEFYSPELFVRWELEASAVATADDNASNQPTVA